jgi:hypothetical protein
LGIKLTDSEDSLSLTNTIYINPGMFYKPRLNRMLTYDKSNDQWMESYPEKNDTTGDNFLILKRVKKANFFSDIVNQRSNN